MYTNITLKHIKSFALYAQEGIEGYQKIIKSLSIVGGGVTPSGVTEDPALQKMRLPKARVVSPNQKQTYVSTPYSKINRKT
jgi:hypothetical protein